MPDTYSTLTGLFTAIADALRARTGDAGPIAARSFPDAIAALPAGGTDTSDATATAADILAGKTAYGADGTKLTGTVPSLAAATITPGAAAQTLAAGSYLAGAQTVAGDANLTAANIKSGVSIFGVAGSLAGPAMTPYAVNCHMGYVSGSQWYYNPSDQRASDVYRVTAGRHYFVCLGAAVGNRFRVIYVTRDPTTATSDIFGTAIGDDPTPTAWCAKPAYCPASDGYIVVFKGNDGSGDAVDSYALELETLG